MIGWVKDIVSWRWGGVLYLSVPFTWLLEAAAGMARAHPGKVVAGGPAVKLLGADWADETPEECPFDVLAMHNPLATMTTRGCPNRCPFCAVPRIEGEFRELPMWRPGPIVCDNNLLAASKRHFKRVIDSLLAFPACDFNGGFEARLFTPWHAGQIARLRRPNLRFGFDNTAAESALIDAVAMARLAGLRNFGVYVLIGFNDTPEDAHYRLDKVRQLGIWPNPMRYQLLDAVRKNAYVAPGWTEKELKRTMRYYARLRYFRDIPYDEFDVPDEPLFAALQTEGAG